MNILQEYSWVSHHSVAASFYSLLQLKVIIHFEAFILTNGLFSSTTNLKVMTSFQAEEIRPKFSLPLVEFE